MQINSLYRREVSCVMFPGTLHMRVPEFVGLRNREIIRYASFKEP